MIAKLKGEMAGGQHPKITFKGLLKWPNFLPLSFLLKILPFSKSTTGCDDAFKTWTLWTS